MILKMIKELREEKVITPAESAFYKILLVMIAMSIIVIPITLCFTLPIEVVTVPVLGSLFIGSWSATWFSGALHSKANEWLDSQCKELISQNEVMTKTSIEDAQMFYKNRLDMLTLPFLPEDFGMNESVIEEEGTTRIYSAQGFTMTRGDDNNWVIATPEKNSSSYRFKTAFHAYHTLESLGYDHSSWQELVKVQ